ncbi:MAG: hypothetical protein MHPSP_004151, partial [Paramarteilia canceri]
EFLYGFLDHYVRYIYHFKNAQHVRLGLSRDDGYRSEVFETAEIAVKRLNEEEFDSRNWRLYRAAILSTKKDVLPEDEWVRPETDSHTLREKIEKAAEEKKEKIDWIKNN